MSGINEEKPAAATTTARASLADDEVKALLAQIAEAVRKGSEREAGFWDRFWERMASISTFVGSVVLGAVALMFNSVYSEQQARQSEAQFDFEKHKFEDEQETQRRATLMQIIPDLFSADEAKREGAQTLLLEFYPNDAAAILGRVAHAHPERREKIAAVVRTAEARSHDVGTWGVVVGHAETLKAARDELGRAGAEGFSAVVYKKGKWFVTVAQGRLGHGGAGFVSEDEADSANFDISRQIRQGTLVVQLKQWCENPQPAGDFVQCVN